MKAIVFDVFGTLVDWRSSLIHQFNELEKDLGIELPSEVLADQWRQLYAPSMDRVRRGEIPWTVLDDLHRESLVKLLNQHGIALDEATIDRVNYFWHQLEPWSDVPHGLQRLKEHTIIATLTNGNVSLMVDVARHAKLPWDMIFCAELFEHYKPDTEVYLGACRLLRLPPEEVMLCAAHNADLRAARALGMKTAFIPRRTEYGPQQSKDLEAEEAWDFVAEDLVALSERLIE
ncbi:MULTISPECIES: haloacid dehalogenase type II [Halomonadaceae]|uniref:(S)-2-haloacid dehalogenase 4A n=1 Tax=Vreelandella titanicae TaxID=664683 RepID=A0A653V7P7_9GAMM|nr:MULTISPECIES: haloacid dehalogenase type II [Halomonas]QKS24430.1 (S)-2-haloacid dehalogenase 4A [Halomonas titanicae]CAD5250688.1 Haloacid dehalogenase [Halomonas sp. 59]CAD5250695.1 Haloacid dehalogenase [Halomonas sp. 113]CAD5257281.1 Haloacid dehalogenase [Halomonas sp. I3]CAD5297437.1 Haloacid dehalogenase [Halomonas sp. 156]|tara:strand:+ start:1440 stop:2135 length:696 start_codon:yes stop_codon:yes gene_type:complete